MRGAGMEEGRGGSVTRAMRLAEAGSDLKGLDREELGGIMAELGEPSYRVEQVMRWMYRHDAADVQAMTNLSQALRERLSARYRIGRLREVTREASVDGTCKLLLALDDGPTVEAVLIPEEGRRTACISSQAGCGIGCTFCATALGGFVRNLSAGEIVDQVLALQRATGEKVTNVVFMGMGEPFANYAQVMRAARLLSDPWAFGIGARHITISTSGVVPAIERFTGEGRQFVLAVSLHAATDAVRDQLVPLNRKYPIDVLIGACRRYVAATRRRITFEYVMIDGVNDTPEQARNLIAITRGLLCHVNLIPWNPVPETGFRRSHPAVIREFAERLRAAGVPTTVRRERGTDIQAACGQLRRSRME